MAQAHCHSYKDLVEGVSHELDYVISPKVYEGFLSIFGDCSPLHVDADYAKRCGFTEILMHGAILNGFVSNFVGMVYPGGKSLELSVDIRYLQPAYLGDTLRLVGKINQKLDVQQVVVLHVTFLNQTRGGTTASGRVQIKIMEQKPY